MKAAGSASPHRFYFLETFHETIYTGTPSWSNIASSREKSAIPWAQEEEEQRPLKKPSARRKFKRDGREIKGGSGRWKKIGQREKRRARENFGSFNHFSRGLRTRPLAEGKFIIKNKSLSSYYLNSRANYLTCLGSDRARATTILFCELAFSLGVAARRPRSISPAPSASFCAALRAFWKHGFSP